MGTVNTMYLDAALDKRLKYISETITPVGIDIQKIIEPINQEYIEKYAQAWDEIDKAGKDFTLKLGNKITTLSVDENRRWEQALKPLYDDYVKSMKDKGLPGEEVLRFVLEQIYKFQK